MKKQQTLTDEQNRAILATLRELEEVIRKMPYASKVASRVSSAEYCKELIQCIRTELSGSGK